MASDYPFISALHRILKMSLRTAALIMALAALPFGAFAAFSITEILPVNTEGLKDEDGTFQPWIELWNTDTANKASLSGYKLVHGGTQWTLPAVEILPDDYIVIFASGKNRTVVTSPLHTNFTLSGTGGSLSLLRPDNGTESSFPSYPALAADVSHGREKAELTLTGNYTSPTPGESNNYTGTGVAGHVLYSAGSRAFTGSLNVALSQETPVAGAVIRYTTNGSVPISTSTAYTAGAQIPITATTLLRARVFETGKLPGETETEGYLLLDGTTSNFNTAAPIIVVSNFGLGTFPDNSDQASFMWVWEPSATDGRARLSNLPTLATRSVVDRRGSSTLGNEKTNFNLEARKGREDSDRDIVLLGMPEGADWVFHAPFHFDRSLMHNPFFYALSNNIGSVAMRTRMAEVFVETNGGALNFTGSGSGDYFGVYNVMEKVRRGKDRVNIAKLDTYDNDAVGKTGGYIFKVDRLDPGDSGFGAAGQGFAYYYPKEIAIKVPQRDPQEQYLTSYLNSANTALYSATYTNPTTGYAAWIDVPLAVDHHLLNTWTFNVDALRLSAYLHKDQEGKIVFGPVWDVDRGLSSTDGRDVNPAVWSSGGGTDFFNYWWFNRLFSDPDFYQRYIDRWVDLRRGQFSPASVNALLDTLNAEITAEAVTRDLARWNMSKRDWTSPFTSTYYPANQAAEVQRLKDYLQQRANFFDSQWVGAVTFSSNGGTISPGFTLTMTKPAGTTAYYTLDGTDPRPSGGAVPSAGNVFVYSGPVTINSTTRVRARAYHPTWSALTGGGNPPLVSKWSGVTEAVFSTDPPAAKDKLVITELQYNPLPNGATDGDQYEFVEFKNISAGTLNLTGLTFTSGITYTFPPGATLSAGSFWVIGRNSTEFTARYPGRTLNGIYTGKLDDGGERLTLVDSFNGAVVDFDYDDVLPWPISADGQGFSIVARTPATHTDPGNALSWRASANIGGSPGADDPADSIAGVLINEVLTNSATPFTDTIELLNPSASAADIGDWWLSDSVSVPKKYRIPTGTMIAAGGYATFSEAQFNPGGGTSFALSQNGGQLYLFSGDAAGNLTGYAHGIEFQAADQNVSFGRFLNSLGYESFLAQISRTFGAANSGPVVGPLVINEIQYNPPAGYDEFIEILNISGATVNLWNPAYPANTWRVDGVGFNFPAASSIPAGGYALVVGIDPATFRTKYQVPAAVQIFGPYPGLLDNGGERIELEKPGTPYVDATSQTIIPYIVVDSVRYSNSTPWPVGAAGTGASLQRQNSNINADDSANWFASGISPGATNVYNAPPAITLLAPLNGTTFTLPAAITLAADAVDTDGYISKVEFFDGAAKIAEVTTAPFIFTWTTATAGTHSISAKATDGSLGITTSATASITVNSGTGSVTGTGWRGEYFKDTNASTHLTVTDNTVRTRTDTTINFNDGTGWPNTLFPGNSEIPAIGTDLFSVRWSAQFLPPSTASYNFYATSAAGVRLYVGGQLVINNWTAHALTTNSASVSLNGGQLYDIVLEFFETSLGAVVSLEYESSGASPPITRAILPASRVYPAGAPIILKQPAAFALTSGSAAVFSVLAAGAQPLSYQWRFNGADIAGATGQSLVLPLPLLTQAGNYSVRITNSLGTVTSSNAALTIPDSDGDGLANYWETLHGLSTSVNDAALDPDEDGKTNLQEFTAGTNPLDPASFLNLIVTPVSGGNTLSFTAQSYKAYGLQYQTGGGPWITLQYYAAEPAQRNITYTDTTTETRTYRVVTPAIPPSIATHPANVTLTNSSFATISVSANGDQPFSYQWQFNGADIAGATSAGLTINSPLVTQSGQYRVRVTNSFGNITSNAATFTVYDGDTDGTPNYWESANGLSVSVADSTLDSDGDGMSNLAEFLANTNPKNASSRLAVAISPAAGAGSTLSFTAQPYRTYGIQYRDSLTSGAWTTLQTYPAAASAQTINYTDPSAPAARFYRIITP